MKRIIGRLLAAALALAPAPALAHDGCYSAVVERVVDGDTVDVRLRLGLGFVLQGQRVRLLGVDAPEMRGEERPAGIVARDALAGLVLGREVRLCVPGDERDSFGRLLGTMAVGGVDAGAWLIGEGLARPYR